jgi:hypothetical protein
VFSRLNVIWSVILSRRKGRGRKSKAKRKLNRRVYGLIPLAICIIVIAYFIWPRSDLIPVNEGVTIVDLFYSSNPQFTDEATAYLATKGLPTNIFKDSNITVDFYRQLPKYGYSLIVLRVHAGVLESDPGKPTFLFTEEPHNTYEYPIEQMLEQVQAGKIDPDNPAEEPVFTVGPLFIAASMEGRFNDSVIILSSCLGLYTDQLANAFIERGAKAFISWDEKVGLTHTDEACMVLLRSLIEEGMTISEAVEKAMNDVGPDTAYNSELYYYPQEAGSVKLMS